MSNRPTPKVTKFHEKISLGDLHLTWLKQQHETNAEIYITRNKIKYKVEIHNFSKLS